MIAVVFVFSGFVRALPFIGGFLLLALAVWMKQRDVSLRNVLVTFFMAIMLIMFLGPTLFVDRIEIDSQKFLYISGHPLAIRKREYPIASMEQVKVVELPRRREGRIRKIPRELRFLMTDGEVVDIPIGDLISLNESEIVTALQAEIHKSKANRE
jgi:hypothetical protein